VRTIAPAMSSVSIAGGPPRYTAASRPFVLHALVFAAAVAVAAMTSEARQWEPVSLVAALAVVMVLADTAVVWARRLGVTAGLVVQVTIMALLGPAPAVAIAVASILLIDAALYRVGPVRTVRNLTIFAVLGLVGGLLFEGLRTALGIGTEDPVYAAVVLPVYVFLSVANLVMAVVGHPYIRPEDWRRTIKESGRPALPLELVNAVLAATAVLLWTQGGVDATVGLLAVLVVVIPLTHSVMDGLRSSDDLRQVSDARAEEVARLAADRQRLLEEVLDAEERERARLAESLHDGPMQRLIALRQDAAEPATIPVAMLAGIEEAIAETRAVISSLHPATSQEMGFEASLRAAIAPFPASRSIELTVHSTVDDRTLVIALPLRIAQELVVNAVKHARPRRIDVRVTREADLIVLEVNDDGVGIDSSDAGRAVQAGHVGLAMVRRRVEDSGGHFDIETRADGGTRSRVALPIRDPV
jgi:signal transduction histidine kinase